MGARISVLLAGVLVVAGAVCGQDRRPGAVRVGDRMPDYRFVNLINYPTREASFSAFGGRFVILDFWSTHCSSCIESWPKLVDIQKRYGDRVQLLLINTDQDEATVRAAFEKRKKLTGVEVTLPTVCGDTVLSSLFPRLGVPHVIWIDTAGVVRSITGGSPLTVKNVGEMLKDPRYAMPQAWDAEPRRVNFAAPLYIGGNGGDGKGLLASSQFARYEERLVSNLAMMGDRRRGRYDKITAINSSVGELFGFAYSDREAPHGAPIGLPYSRMIFEGFDSVEYIAYRDGIRQEQNHYRYQLISDTSDRWTLQEKMQEDLRRFFGYEVKWERRRVACRVLRDGDTLLLSRPDPRKYMQGVTESMFSLNGGFRFVDAVWFLESVHRNSAVPIVNETKMKGFPQGIEIAVDVKDFDKLDAALRQYGMSLKEEYRRMPMLVIRKKSAVVP